VGKSTVEDSAVDSCGTHCSSDASTKVASDDSDSESDSDRETSMLRLHTSRMVDRFRQSRMDVERRSRSLPAFFTEKVEAWFSMIDTNGDGLLTQLELRVALQNNLELQAVFCQGLGMPSGVRPPVRQPPPSHRPLPAKDASAAQAAGASAAQAAQERTEVFRENSRRATSIIKQLDWGKERRLDCPAFVDFFRKRGMLLE